MEGSLVIKGLRFLYLSIEDSLIYRALCRLALWMELVVVNSLVYRFFTTDFNMLEKWRVSYLGRGFYWVVTFFWKRVAGLAKGLLDYGQYSLFGKLFQLPYRLIGTTSLRENMAFLLGILLTALGTSGPMQLIGLLLLVYLAQFQLDKGLYAVFLLVPLTNSTYLTVLVAGLLVSFVFQGKKGYSLKIEPYFLLFFVFVAGAVVTSSVRASSFKSLLLYLTPMAFGYMVIYTLNSKEKLLILLKLGAVSGVLQSLYAWLQYKFKLSMGGTWVDLETFGEVTTRAMGSLGNPNVLAEYLVLVVIMGCILLVIEKSWQGRLFYGGAIGLMLMGLALTLSRGGYLSFVFAVLIFLVLIDRRLIFVFAMGLLAMTALMPGLILKRFSSITNLADTSNAYRISIWIGTLDLIRSNWLLGTGLGLVAFSETYQYFVYGSATAVHSHNLLLQIASEMGVFGLFTFLLFVAALVKWALISSKTVQDRDLKYVIFALVGALGAHILHGAVDFVWYDPRMLFMFWTLVGILICSIERGQEGAGA